MAIMHNTMFGESQVQHVSTPPTVKHGGGQAMIWLVFAAMSSYLHVGFMKYNTKSPLCNKIQNTLSRMKYKDEEKPLKKCNHMRISEGETTVYYTSGL